MYRKPGFWRKFIYLFVVITQLGQSVVSALAPSAVPNNASAPSSRSTASVIRSKPKASDPQRPAWVRPTVEPATSFRPLVPPETIVLTPPVTAEDSPALLGLFPFGNNNTGQSYKDTNNPEDHPGKHFAGPVNLVNGNYFLTAGDHFFAASGLSVQLARSYNSQDTFPAGPFGNGWTHSYNSLAQETIPGTQVIIRNGDGSQHVYSSADGGLTWEPPAGIFRTLTHPAPTAPFQVIHKSGVVENFNPNGQLQSITDRNGNSVQMNYDGMNRLIVVASDDGRALTFTYSPTNPNLIATITDPLDRITSYSYSPSGNLTQVNYPEGTVATYVYDGSNRLSSFSDPRQPEGARQVTDIQYDGLNRTNRVEFNPTSFFSLTYGIAAGPFTQTNWQDALGQTHSIQYDANFNIITSFSFFAGCSCIQGEGYNYDANLLLQSKQDSLGNLTVYFYDTIGNMVRVVSPSGAQTDFGYDPVLSNVISTTNPAGETIQYLYDAGNLIQEIHPLGRTAAYTYDASGNLLTQTDALGNTTTYTYDPAGNLLTVTDPENSTTTFTYDAIGRVTEKVDPRGGITQYQYDAADRLLQVTDPLSGTIGYLYDARGNLISLTDANGQTIQHQYDDLDRLIVVTNSLGLTTTYQYDGLRRLTVRTDATGATTSYAYDEAHRMTQRLYSDGRIDNFTYDPTGNLIGYTDGSSFTGIQYDNENRPITYTLNTAAFSSPTRIIYAYDPLGNRTKATINDGSNSYTTDYVYDSLNRLVLTTDTNGRAWTTTYDTADRRTSLTYPDNSHVEYEYNGRNNLTAVRHYDPGNSLQRVYTYTHDSLSNLLTENDNGQVTTFNYDPLNRVTQAVTPNDTATYSYDAVGNRLTITGTPYGTNTFTYDAANNLLSSNDSTYTYDSMGRRTSDAGPAGSHLYEYDGEMRLTHWQVDSFFDVFLSYDSMGRLVRKQDSDGGDTFFLHGDRGIEAELDSSGNVKGAYTIDTEIIAMSLVNASPITVDFRYDGGGRVRQVTDADSGQPVAEYSTDPTENHPAFYNPIRIIGTYYFPEMGLYLAGDGLFWDPISGLFLCRFWPWAFWPFGPFSPWRPIFRYWPWPWPWATPWGWPWPRPWPFLWPWPGVWVRPFLIWPMWSWPFFPWLPWWWWSAWWGWPIWSHWWWWHHWWWWGHWWHFGWWWWGWWGWGWWLWGWWWWPWWWWWPCWWIWGWWIWWWWWPWWHWWHWHWWWWPWWYWWWGWWFWWWWPPVWARPPDYGDAPDPSYPSLLGSNGARHLNTYYEWLGMDVDREFNAEITDLDMFDDGVAVDLSNGLITFTVSTRSAFYWYSAAAPVNVHGWIDWNADGDWSEPGEFVLNWSGYPGDGIWPAGATSFTTSAPVVVPGVLPLQMWSRFRLDYAQNVETVTGWANRGEVEDYLLYSAPNPPSWGGAVNVNLTAPLVLTYPVNMVVNTVNIDFTPAVSHTVLWSNPLAHGGSSVATILHEPFEPLTTYTVTVSAGQTVGGHWMPANSYTFTTQAEPVYGVSLSPDMAQSGQPGTPVTYTVQVTNTGNSNDLFDLSLSGNSWQTAVNPTTIAVNPGETEMIEVIVSIPLTATIGQMDTATVTATSQGGGVQAMADLVTTAIAPPESGAIIYLPFMTKGN